MSTVSATIAPPVSWWPGRSDGAGAESRRSRLLRPLAQVGVGDERQEGHDLPGEERDYPHQQARLRVRDRCTQLGEADAHHGPYLGHCGRDAVEPLLGLD